MNKIIRLLIGLIACNLFIFSGVYLIIVPSSSNRLWDLLTLVVGTVGVTFGELTLIKVWNVNHEK